MIAAITEVANCIWIAITREREHLLIVDRWPQNYQLLPPPLETINVRDHHHRQLFFLFDEKKNFLVSLLKDQAKCNVRNFALVLSLKKLHNC